MKNTIKSNLYKSLFIIAFVAFLGHMGQAQILGGLLNNTFEEITVNKRAVFSGEVQLNQGLWLNGRAQLSDGLTSIGGMDISGDIVFNSLSLVTDLSENALVVVDPQGNIRRLSGFDALQSIIENRAIDFQQEISMPELSVLQNLKLFGAVELGEDVLFSGDAAFADDVSISQSLNVAEEIRTATAIVENLEVNESIRTTGLVAEGVIESAGLSTEGIIKAAAVEADRVDVESTLRIGAMALDTALGTTAFVTTSTTGELLRMGEEQLAVALGPIFTPRPNECLTTPGGSIPRWNYDVNKIVIDDCSRGTANVGLGTLDPTAKLDVIGTVKSRGLEVERGNALIRGAGNFDATDDEATVFLGDTEHGITAKRGFGLSMWTFQHNNALVIRQQNGFVGIGKSNPSHPLDVSGRLNANELQIEGGNATVKGANNFAAVADEAYLYLGDTEHSIMAKRGTGVSLSTFGNPNTLVLSEVNGGVGIGIGEDVPQAQLHIKGANQNLIYVESTLADANNPNSTQRFKVTANGKTYTNEVNVQLSDFPDYVFAQDYSLMPLSQLKQSIKENHKLPNMPSAAEVAKNGADLGELNRLLVEKVEELTLYIIQLEERMRKLEQDK